MLVKRLYLVLLLSLIVPTGSIHALSHQPSGLTNTLQNLMSSSSKVLGRFAEPVKKICTHMQSLVTLMTKRYPIIQRHPVASLATVAACSAALFYVARPIMRLFNNFRRAPLPEPPLPIVTHTPNTAAPDHGHGEDLPHATHEPIALTLPLQIDQEITTIPQVPIVTASQQPTSPAPTNEQPAHHISPTNSPTPLQIQPITPVAIIPQKPVTQETEIVIPTEPHISPNPSQEAKQLPSPIEQNDAPSSSNSPTQKTPVIQPIEQKHNASAPLFIVLSADEEFLKNSKTFIQGLMQQGLTNSLQIGQTNIEDCEITCYQSSFFAQLWTGISSWPKGFDFVQVNERVTQAKEQNRPIVILCDEYGTKHLKEILSTAETSSIHSVILLNPSVIQDINFDAVAHRIYNFYSKVRDWHNATAIRKYNPGSTGFSLEGSKVVNISCMQENGGPVSFDNKLQACATIGIPGLINQIEQNFHFNWDLAASVTGTNGAKVFFNRALQVDASNKTIINPEEKNLVVNMLNPDWEYKCTDDQAFEDIADGLGLEEATNNQVITSCHNDQGTCLYPAAESVPYTRLAATTKPLEAAAFFVPSPSDHRFALVAFICSPNISDINKSSFSLHIGEQILECQYFVNLGTQPNLEGISYYYAIAKFFLKKEELMACPGQHFNLFFKNTPLTGTAQGTVPTLPNNDFTFIAVGDVQKQTQKYSLDDPQSGSTIYPLSDLLVRNEQQANMQLIVGDFVRNGVNLPSWNEVLSKLSSMSMQETPAIMASAIGSHDFANVDLGILRFFPNMPTHGHLFNFTGREQEIQTLAPQEHVNRTAGWFDMGRVRFIHLPYTTEEEASVADTLKTGLYPLNFDHMAIYGQFEQNLLHAVEARKSGIIDFIIVYGHAPLATAPQYTHGHEGLFNSLANFQQNQTKNPMGTSKCEFANRLLNLLRQLPVDLYLSGHNHQYERLTISNTNGSRPFLTALTIGLGTTLRHAKLKTDTHTDKQREWLPGPEKLSGNNFTITSEKMISGEQAHSNEYREFFDKHGRLPAYLECAVRGKILGCTLKTSDNHKLDGFEIQAQDALLQRSNMPPQN